MKFACLTLLIATLAFAEDPKWDFKGINIRGSTAEVATSINRETNLAVGKLDSIHGKIAKCKSDTEEFKKAVEKRFISSAFYKKQMAEISKTTVVIETSRMAYDKVEASDDISLRMKHSSEYNKDRAKLDVLNKELEKQRSVLTKDEAAMDTALKGEMAELKKQLISINELYRQTKTYRDNLVEAIRTSYILSFPVISEDVGFVHKPRVVSKEKGILTVECIIFDRKRSRNGNSDGIVIIGYIPREYTMILTSDDETKVNGSVLVVRVDENIFIAKPADSPIDRLFDEIKAEEKKPQITNNRSKDGKSELPIQKTFIPVY